MMNELTRNKKRTVKANASEKSRKAKNARELELVFTIGSLYIINYYDKRPVRRFLAKLGVRDGSVSGRYMDRAKNELSDVDYDFKQWQWRYGSNDTKSLVKD